MKKFVFVVVLAMAFGGGSPAQDKAGEETRVVVLGRSLEKLPEADLVEQIKKEYSGEWVSARDLGVY